MANETELERLIVRLTGDSTSYQKMMADAVRIAQQSASEVEKSTSRIEAATVAKGELIAAGVEYAIDKFKELGREAIEAFTKHETATVKLRASIEAAGHAVQSTVEDYEEFADAISKTTTAGKVQVEHLLQLAESYGVTGEQAKQAAKWAIGVGEATETSAESAIRFTAAFAKSGNAEGLSRILRTLQAIDDPIKKAAEATRLLNADFKVAESIVDTTEGAFINLHKSVHGLLREFGESISGVLKPLSQAAKYVIDSFLQLDPVVKKIVITVSALAVAIAAVQNPLLWAGMVTTLNAVRAVFASLLTPVGLVSAAVVALGAVVVYNLGGMEKTVEKLKEGFKELVPLVKEANAVMMEFWHTVGRVQVSTGDLGTYLQGTFTKIILKMRDDLLNTLLVWEFNIKHISTVWKMFLGGTVEEEFQKFKAERLKALFGTVGEGAEGAAGAVGNLGKAIGDLTKGRDAAAFFSGEAADRMSAQFGNVVVAATKAANAVTTVHAAAVGGAPAAGGGGGGFFQGWKWFGHPIGPQAAAAAAPAQAAVRNQLPGGRPIGGGGFPTPASGKWLAVGTAKGMQFTDAGKPIRNVQREVEAMAGPIFDRLPQALGPNERWRVALARAWKIWHENHPDDAMNEPGKESVRIYGGEGSRRVSPVPKRPTGGFTTPPGYVVPPRQTPATFGNEDVIPGYPAGPHSPEALNQMLQDRRQMQGGDEVVRLLQMIHNVLAGKKTLEVKPLGLT